MREKVARLANPKYWHVCDKCHAEYSTGKYRYALYRCVDAYSDKGTVLFIMLNPSTAHETDETQNDHTIQLCKGFAKRWRYGQLVVGNLSPLRAKKPKKLRELKVAGHEPPCVQQANLNIIECAAEMADKIVLAWGANGTREDHIAVKGVLQCFADKVYYLDKTAGGYPRHPQGVPYTQTPHPWKDMRGQESNS